MKKVKILFCCVAIMLGIVLATTFQVGTSSAAMTKEQKAWKKEIKLYKKEIKQANKRIANLQTKYDKQKRKRKNAMKAYKISSKKVEGKGILFATVLDTNPLIINSNYPLCPIKGYYCVTNGSAMGKSFTGTIRLTGGYYNYNGIQCAKAVVIETQSLRDLRKVTKIEKKMKSIKRQITSERKEIKRCKKEIKHINLIINNEIFITGMEEGLLVGETGSYDVAWKSEDAMCDIKWTVSDSSLVEIKKSTRWIVKVKPLAAGEVTLTAKLTGNGCKKSFNMKIYPAVTDIILQEEIIYMMPGEEKEIVAKCLPEDTKQEIKVSSPTKWGSSVAQVEGTKVKALSGGVTTFIVEAGKMQKEIKIVVQNCITSINSSENYSSEIKKDISDSLAVLPYANVEIDEGDYGDRDVIMNLFRADEINQDGKFMEMWFDVGTEVSGEPAIENVQCVSSDSSVIKPVVVNSCSDYDGEEYSYPISLVLELVKEGEATITVTTTKGITLNYTVMVYDSTAVKITKLSLEEEQVLTVDDFRTLEEELENAEYDYYFGYNNDERYYYNIFDETEANGYLILPFEIEKSIEGYDITDTVIECSSSDPMVVFPRFIQYSKVSYHSKGYICLGYMGTGTCTIAIKSELGFVGTYKITVE